MVPNCVRWGFVMVFSSLIFLYAFFPLSLGATFLCRRSKRAQNWAMLVSSLIFYAWGEPKHLLLLMGMALASWLCALGVDRGKRPKVWLAAAVVIDLGLIGYFKYAGFLLSIFGAPPAWAANIVLPIGISFYTFQLLTYVIDVYRGDAEAQESYWNVLLYASLFHQCIAGPIVRYKTVADELFVHREEGPELLSGIRRFTVGLAKKTLLANPCGALADQLLLETSAASDASLFAQNLASLKSLTVLGSWVGVLAFTLQIYLDFSAYSDMAIGMGRMIGLHYLENFDYPYISKSVTEFWRRWHMSLGTFFRDYVYIPLGGNRCSRARSILNMFIVWALTGLWHGASWNFVMWGLYFFVFLLLERLFLKKPLRKLRVLPHIYLCFVVYVGWIIFHFTDIRLGWTVFTNLFGLNGNAFSSFVSKTVLENNLFLLIASCVFCTPLVKNLCLRAGERLSASETGAKVWDVLQNCVMPVAFLLLATCSLVGDSYNPFIYFQF